MFEIKPKTRKEIYMAYLAGDMSLELPEPMTRDEVTLYNLCQSHAYGSTTTVKEVLAECQPEYNAEVGYFGIATKFHLDAGQEYIVTVNGTEYKATAVDASDTEVDADLIATLLTNDGGLTDPENMVFGIACYMDEAFEMSGYGGMVQLADGSTTLTISIRQEVTTVTKLSGKYVEGMGWSEKQDNAVIVDNVTVNGEFTELGNGVFTAGQSYTVVFDGVRYENLVCFDEYESSIIGSRFGDYTEYPFFICSSAGKIICVTSDAGKHVVTVTGFVETIHPIERKYLPGMIVRIYRDESGYFADKTAQEIYDIHKAGGIVEAEYQGGLFTLFDCRKQDGTLYVGFERLDFGSHLNGRENFYFENDTITKEYLPFGGFHIEGYNSKCYLVEVNTSGQLVAKEVSKWWDD